jgi:hypothetical protein
VVIKRIKDKLESYLKEWEGKESAAEGKCYTKGRLGLLTEPTSGPLSKEGISGGRKE